MSWAWIINILADVGAPAAVLLVVFWKLIPGLQQQFNDALAAFREEMAEERKFHKESLDRVVDGNRHIIELVRSVTRK